MVWGWWSLCGGGGDFKKGEDGVGEEGEGWVRPVSGQWPGRVAGWVVDTAVQTRGGFTGVADEPVMKPGVWAPFVLGMPFKKPLPQPPVGLSGAMVCSAVGHAERSL